METRNVKVQKRRIQTAAVSVPQRNARNVIRKRKQDLLRRINYTSVATAVVLPLAAFIYLAHTKQGLVPENSNTLLFSVIYYNFTMLAFTAGYHKCYAHSTFRPRYSFLHLWFGVFGASVGVGPIRTWAAMHRAHHQYTDDPEKDPYSIKRGFLWAHWGWLLKKPKTTTFYREFVEHEFPSSSEPVESQQADTDLFSPSSSYLDLPLEEDDETNTVNASRIEHSRITLSWVLWQEPRFLLFFILTTIIIPIVITVFVCGDTWINGLIYPGILRMFACQQSNLSTESVCHFKRLGFTIPLQPFNDKNSSVNCANPLIAMLTYGQASQNYHHEFPHDYRASSSFWAVDPTKWLIFTLSKLGLVEDVAKAPQSLVMQLQLQQQQHVLNHMKSQLNWGTPISKLPMISTKEFRKLSSASTQDRIYIVIQNIIHDITPFMDQHPGGLPLLRASHGKDATKAFYGGVYGHSTAAVNLLATMRIGVLDVGNNEDVWSRAQREDQMDDDDRRQGQQAAAEAA